MTDLFAALAVLILVAIFLVAGIVPILRLGHIALDDPTCSICGRLSDEPECLKCFAEEDAAARRRSDV